MKVFAAFGLAAMLLTSPACAHRCELTCRQTGTDAMGPPKVFCAEEYTPRTCTERANKVAKQRHLSCRALWADHCRLAAEKLEDSEPPGTAK